MYKYLPGGIVPPQKPRKCRPRSSHPRSQSRRRTELGVQLYVWITGKKELGMRAFNKFYSLVATLFTYFKYKFTSSVRKKSLIAVHLTALSFFKQRKYLLLPRGVLGSTSSVPKRKLHCCVRIFTVQAYFKAEEVLTSAANPRFARCSLTRAGGETKIR